VAGAVLPLVAWGVLKRMGDGWARFARLWIFWEGCLFALYVMQLVFNQDFWDRASRYAFPGEVIAAFAWFVPLILAWQMRDRLAGLTPARLALLQRVAAGLLLAVVLVRGYKVPRDHARMNRDLTRAWSAKLNEVAQAAKADPALVVAISTRSIGTFEEMWSAKQFLQQRGVDNPIVLRVDESRLAPWNWPGGMTPVMIEDIRRARRGELGYAPAALLDSGRPCIEVSLTRELLLPSPCRILGSVRSR
jgi:low affinity Fe/Cu permease